jgi:hypothetical protein
VELSNDVCVRQKKTVAICAEATFDCGDSKLFSQVNAPCQVSSTTGQCSIGSGQYGFDSQIEIYFLDGRKVYVSSLKFGFISRDGADLVFLL